MILPSVRQARKQEAPSADCHGLFKFALPRYGLLDGMATIDDGRDERRRRVPLAGILLAVTAGLCLGLGSLLGIEDRLRRSAGFSRLVRRFGVGAAFGDDTMREGLTRLNWRQLRGLLHMQGRREMVRWGAGRYRDCALARKLAGVNQAHLAAKVVVALDGHEFISGDGHDRCADCKVRWKEVKRGKHLTELVPEFYHQVLVVHWIGTHPALVLDFEPILPGDSEWTAAQRLLPRLKEVYGERIGIIVADAFYDHEPFRRCVARAGYHSVVRHKDPRRQPGGDGKRKLDRRDPSREKPLVTFTGANKRRYKVWEEEESSDGRRYVEVVCPDDPGAGGGCVTSLPASAAHAAAIGLLMEARWWIENACFHETAGQWHLDRAFVHKGRPTAVWAMVAMVFLAFNLWQAYVYRELRLAPDRPVRTHVQLRRDLWETLARGPKPVPVPP